MCHCKEIENGCKKIMLICLRTEHHFRANLLLGYAQSGSERTSFSGLKLITNARLGTLSIFVRIPKRRQRNKAQITKSGGVVVRAAWCTGIYILFINLLAANHDHLNLKS